MAGNNIKGITIEIGGETSGLQNALKGVNDTSRNLQNELKSVDKLLKLDPENTELLAQKQTLLAEAVANTKTKLDTLKEAERQVQQQFANGEVSEEQYRGLQREIIATEQNLKNLEISLQNTNDKWADFASKAKDVGEKTTEVGKKFSVGVTAPIAAIGAAATVAWTEVDGALDTIITKTGATGEAAESLNQSFKNVASTLPVDLQTAGDAVGEVNTQFGLMGTELDDATSKVLKFSQINGQDVSQTAISARQAIEAYGLSTEDLGGVLDAVTKTAQNTGQSTTDLFNAVTTGAPQIQALGLDFAQAAELIGSFEQQGIDSGKALGYLGKARVAFAEDGKTLEQGLNDTITAIKNSTSETEALTLASEVFGTKGATFMLDAINRGALSFDDLSNAAENASGSVESTFDSTLDPIDKATTAMNNLKLAGADLGTALQETLAPMLDSLVSALQGFTTWFSGLSDGTKKMIVTIGLVLAAIGPVLIVVGQVIAAIGVVGTAISTVSGAIAVVTTGVAAATPAIGTLAAVFTALTGPIGIAIAAIVAIGVALTVLWNTNEDFRSAVTEIWNSIKEFLSTTMNAIKDIITTIFNALKDFWNTWGESIKAVFNIFLEAFKVAFDLAFMTIKTIVETVFQTIKTVIDTVLKVISTIIKTYLQTVQGVFKTIMQAISGDWSGAWNTLKTTASNLLSGISTVISTSLNGIKTVFSDLVGNAFNWGKNLISGFIDGIKSMIGKVKDTASSVTKAVSGYLGFNSPSKEGEGRFITNWGENMIGGFLDGVKNAIPDVSSVVGQATSVAGQALNNTTTSNVYSGGNVTINMYNPQVASTKDINNVSRQLQKQITTQNRTFGIA